MRVFFVQKKNRAMCCLILIFTSACILLFNTVFAENTDTSQEQCVVTKKKFGRGPDRRQDINRLAKRTLLTPITAEEEIASELFLENAENLEDAAIATVRTTPAQNIALNFTAATVANAQNPYVIPPNLNGWVGENQYILMTYNIIRSFNKTTGDPDGILNIDADSFFGVSANDVRIDYDRFSQRWFMSCEGIDNTTGLVSTLVLAFSDSSVISKTTVWTFKTFTNQELIPGASGNGDLDYQQLAIDQNALYLSVDTFDQNGNFRGSSVVVIQKSSIATGSPGSLVYTVFPGVLPSSEFLSPADNFDATPTFGYLINSSNGQFPSSNVYKKLYLYRIINPGSATPSLGSLVSITVPNYTNPANAPYKGNAFLADPRVAFLQTGFAALGASHVRNHQLYVCHNLQVNRSGVASSSGDRVGVRWYQFDLTGDPTGHGAGTETITTMPVLIQSGTLFDSVSKSSPLFYYIPSIMTDKNGNLVISCTVSGANAYPNVVYAGRKVTDPKGVLRSPVMITNNSYSYNFGPFVNPSNANIGQRWGDLSSLCPDPINDLDIWATQEFAAVQNGWGVQVTKLTPA